jgi:enoyl-CoA hydratase/3-hydroxyacyl-CoA dehydrogenase
MVSTICGMSLVLGTQRLPRLVGLTKALEMMLVSISFKRENSCAVVLLLSYFCSFISFYLYFNEQLSKPIKAEEANALGLVDALVPQNELISAARKWALDIYECRRPWVRSLYRTDKIEPLGEAREILKFARMQVQKQAANLTHPLICIDVIEEGIINGPRAGLWKVGVCVFCLHYYRTCLYKHEMDLQRNILSSWSQLMA